MKQKACSLSWFFVLWTEKIIAFSGLVGEIIDAITEGGFQISGITYVTLDPTSAEEFLEIYRGLLPEFSGMVVQLSSGPCLALAIKGQGSQTPKEFR